MDGREWVAEGAGEGPPIGWRARWASRADMSAALRGTDEREQTQDRCAVWGLGMEVNGEQRRVVEIGRSGQSNNIAHRLYYGNLAGCVSLEVVNFKLVSVPASCSGWVRNTVITRSMY